MTQPVTFYQMAINNVAEYMKSFENQKNKIDGDQITAFEASVILSIVFAKSKEEIILDMLIANV